MQLTQDVIYNYTRRNVDRIKSLKIVGFGLTDVSILRGAVSVEILNLTSNQIGTLSHFADCSELQQLLLRDNNIREFREIEYLKDLKNLHTLVLSQNPFCVMLGSEYRAMVLRVLPNLTFLDMLEVTREELAASLLPRQLRQGRSGRTLGYPGHPRRRSNVLTASLNLVMDLNLNELAELEAAVRNRIQAVTQD
ncbi:cilia- and flagella-associated protein 410-like [Drosophila obscura]|uniref:cilia- and flagella-associated protein 410-like n=1 Tax=Drosophila obscura TaxID=7282 RepID=UPI000BA0479D|nr:cilia- and flagella-associated protein 410-like [Drosophila obscura]